MSIFIAGSAIYELLMQLTRPTIWSNGSIALTLLTLAAFVLAGALFANEQHAASRVSSAAALFILGCIALRVGHSAIPDAYLLVIAFCVAIIGARTMLHRKLATLKHVILYSLLTLFISLVIVTSFSYVMVVIDRISINQQYGS